jgi:Rrf2 family protein
MNLSKTTEYAIQILIHLGRDETQLQTSKNIHELLNIPPKYLWKIMNSLQSLKFVSSVRGKNGGYKINTPLSQIFIIDIVKLFQSFDAIHRCILGYSECSVSNPCTIHRFWESGDKQFNEMLTNVSIKELINENLLTDKGEVK